jgi:hypothetical protein
MVTMLSRRWRMQSDRSLSFEMLLGKPYEMVLTFSRILD